MRGWSKQPPAEGRERYLGEIAPFLEAAQEIGTLTSVQKKQVRRRIMRTLFGNRQLHVRLRLAPVLGSVVLLIVGGAAFATAERLGLIPRIERGQVDEQSGEASPQAHRRKSGRVRPEARRPPVPEQPTVVEPAPTVVTPNPPTRAQSAVVSSSPSSSFSGTDARPAVKHAARGLAFVQPSTTPEPRATGSAAAPALPAVVAPTAPFILGPVGASPALGSLPAPAPVSVVAPFPPAASAVPTAPATDSPTVRPPLTDQALFGQAMRRLRTENDPSRALWALEEHARTYPHSPFAGERTALEIEALLALHRDRDALGLLDSAPLDQLPRSGERLVVRGELRAAARRWAEASADFDRALSRTSGSPAWHERALWGRGVARIRLGEREAGMADIEHYLDSYPNGRFAAEANRFSKGSSSSAR
jgi:hypothetical protein